MKKESQLASSRSVDMRETNALSAPISRIKTLRDDEGRRGFTLIEILVAILIVGILTIIAVPQYQKAVEHSRAQEGLLALKTIQQAYDMYYITHGAYATTFAQLDVKIPWEGKSKWNTANVVTDTQSNKEWSLQIYQERRWHSLLIGKIAGQYKGAGFAFIYQTPDRLLPVKSVICMERTANGVAFKRKEGDFCQKIMKGTFITKDSTVRYYSLPFNK